MECGMQVSVLLPHLFTIYLIDIVTRSLKCGSTFIRSSLVCWWHPAAIARSFNEPSLLNLCELELSSLDMCINVKNHVASVANPGFLKGESWLNGGGHRPCLWLPPPCLETAAPSKIRHCVAYVLGVVLIATVQTTINGTILPWVYEMRYFGVFNMSSNRFKRIMLNDNVIVLQTL